MDGAQLAHGQPRRDEPTVHLRRLRRVDRRPQGAVLHLHRMHPSEGLHDLLRLRERFGADDEPARAAQRGR